MVVNLAQQSAPTDFFKGSHALSDKSKAVVSIARNSNNYSSIPYLATVSLKFLVKALKYVLMDFQVKDWLAVLDSMQASDELSETQVRQLIFDLESSYNAFNKLLHNSS